ncbi:hypothetical protein F5Y17DRAFT_471735 [Xylariaceae sp. FL0594]|nr:hypothetical protein F5Y17DRAFT_471735 [Xylariaceae sp. FL0594]
MQSEMVVNRKQEKQGPAALLPTPSRPRQPSPPRPANIIQTEKIVGGTMEYAEMRLESYKAALKKAIATKRNLEATIKSYTEGVVKWQKAVAVLTPNRSKKIIDSIPEFDLPITLDLDLGMQLVPYKPPDDERDNYYHGFSGCPRLVARTSYNRWTKTMYEVEIGWTTELTQHRKYYVALQERDDPDIVSKWTQDVSMNILNALSQCRWSYFFPTRTCLRENGWCQKGPAPIILLVAVEPGSLTWEEGLAIASNCRDVIRKYKIFDVEVEIMEGGYTHHAACPKLETLFDSACPETSYRILPLLRIQDIPLHTWKIGKGREQWDCMSNWETMTTLSTALLAVMLSAATANATTMSTILSDIIFQQNETGCLAETLRTRIEQWDKILQYDNPNNILPPTDMQRQRHAANEKKADHARSVLQVLKDIEERGDRKIGHLAYLPSFGISSRQKGYLTDWALVELDREKFANKPDNRVFLGFSNKKYRTERTLELPDHNSPAECRPIVVVKRGATTGLTYGTLSGIDAVVRRPGDGLVGEVYTWDLLIVPKMGTDRFSHNGDSGAAIFDGADQVVGIVTASTGVPNDRASWRGNHNHGSSSPRREAASKAVKLPPKTDITFAAPIDWVVDDIEVFTGKKLRLA